MVAQGVEMGNPMTGTGTLTRADLAESVNRHVGLSRAEAAALIESLLGHMSDALERGENVKISRKRASSPIRSERSCPPGWTGGRPKRGSMPRSTR